MPALLGSIAEFIPNLDFPHLDNGVFKLDSLTNDSILIGYISQTSMIIFLNLDACFIFIFVNCICQKKEA